MVVSDLYSLVRLTKAQAKPAAEMLAGAFQDYPPLVHYFPNKSGREKIARYIASVDISIGLRYGEVYATSPNLEGVAVWSFSDSYPVSFWKLLCSVPLSIIIGLAMHGGARLKQIGEYMDSVHLRMAPFPHWILRAIGVCPDFQGKGNTGKLLRPMLARIDKEGLPCYLETLDENNVALYGHFGFKVLEKSKIPETGLTYWVMLREKRT